MSTTGSPAREEAAAHGAGVAAAPGGPVPAKVRIRHFWR
jgi:hypothetical protein